jgi:hypothetical protein
VGEEDVGTEEEEMGAGEEEKRGGGRPSASVVTGKSVTRSLRAEAFIEQTVWIWIWIWIWVYVSVFLGSQLQ